MYAVQAFIGDYFKKGFISYNEAVAHADKKCAEDGQPYQVVEMKLMYQVTPTKLQLQIKSDYMNAVTKAFK